MRYRPAAHEAQVGGDRYDAFLQPDGATMLVIGDVVDHDSDAAAAMGQAVRDLGRTPLEELCDTLLARMLPVDGADDVAIVAVRAHPEDRPRPPEAGPNRLPPGVD